MGNLTTAVLAQIKSILLLHLEQSPNVRQFRSLVRDPYYIEKSQSRLGQTELCQWYSSRDVRQAEPGQGDKVDLCVSRRGPFLEYGSRSSRRGRQSDECPDDVGFGCPQNLQKGAEAQSEDYVTSQNLLVAERIENESDSARTSRRQSWLHLINFS